MTLDQLQWLVHTCSYDARSASEKCGNYNVLDYSRQSFGPARIADNLDAGLGFHTSSAFALSSLTNANYKLEAIRQRYRLVAYAGERENTAIRPRCRHVNSQEA